MIKLQKKLPHLFRNFLVLLQPLFLSMLIASLQVNITLL